MREGIQALRRTAQKRYRIGFSCRPSLFTQWHIQTGLRKIQIWAVEGCSLSEQRLLSWMDQWFSRRQLHMYFSGPWMGQHIHTNWTLLASAKSYNDFWKTWIAIHLRDHPLWLVGGTKPLVRLLQTAVSEIQVASNRWTGDPPVLSLPGSGRNPIFFHRSIKLLEPLFKVAAYTQMMGKWLGLLAPGAAAWVSTQRGQPDTLVQQHQRIIQAPISCQRLSHSLRPAVQRLWSLRPQEAGPLESVTSEPALHEKLTASTSEAHILNSPHQRRQHT